MFEDQAMFEDRGEIEWRFHVGPAEKDGSGPSWREVDRQLRRVARRRAAVDAEELHWLALAESAQVHRISGWRRCWSTWSGCSATDRKRAKNGFGSHVR